MFYQNYDQPHPAEKISSGEPSPLLPPIRNLNTGVVKVTIPEVDSNLSQDVNVGQCQELESPGIRKRVVSKANTEFGRLDTIVENDNAG